MAYPETQMVSIKKKYFPLMSHVDILIHETVDGIVTLNIYFKREQKSGMKTFIEALVMPGKNNRGLTFPQVNSVEAAARSFS